MIVYRFRADTAPLFALKYPGVGVTPCGYPPGYVYAVGTSGQAQGPAPTIFFASITRVVRCMGGTIWADTGVLPYDFLCLNYPPGYMHGGTIRAGTGVWPYGNFHQ